MVQRGSSSDSEMFIPSKQSSIHRFLKSETRGTSAKCSAKHRLGRVHVHAHAHVHVHVLSPHLRGHNTANFLFDICAAVYTCSHLTSSVLWDIPDLVTFMHASTQIATSNSSGFLRGVWFGARIFVRGVASCLERNYFMHASTQI